MRIFAGPNGSGKTTIFKGILADERVSLGVYINADDIEITLREKSTLAFSNLNLEVTESQLKKFFQGSTFSPVKRNEPDLWTKLSVHQNILICNTSLDSYIAADIAEFIRQQLLDQGISFTYETVMSHKGKIEFLTRRFLVGFEFTCTT